MMRLAIRGTDDKETGKKLIEILELLGGVNENGLLGDHYRYFYYIDDDNLICCEFEENMLVCHYTTHTLESFNDKYPYRPGDTVRLKDGPLFKITGIRWSNGTIVYDGVMSSYFMPLETTVWPKNILCKISQDVDNTVIKYNYPIEGMYQIKKGTSTYYDVMDGYEVVEKCGAVRLKKTKPKYPKTYEECCDVLGVPPYYNLRYHTYERGYNEYATMDSLISLQDKLNTLGKLIICRDAYWKLAGDWKPNWNETNDCIINWNNEIKCEPIIFKNDILAFPDEAMRDAFYENFKDLIETCKEFI